MNVTKLGGDGEQTYVLVFEDGDEVTDGLLEFVRRTHITGAHFSAIGALSAVELGYFDWPKKAYRSIPIEEQVEVLSLLGDIALDENGTPRVHAHVVVGRVDGTAHGGHLLRARVRPTLELILSQSPRALRRRLDPDTGLALIDPSR